MFVFFLIYFFIYFWVCWVFVSVWRISPVAASGGHSSSRCSGLSLSRPLLLQSTGSRRAGSAIVAHGPSCSAACGIFPDQGSNQCPLHWQADSQPLRHQGSPIFMFLMPCLWQPCQHQWSDAFFWSSLKSRAVWAWTHLWCPCSWLTDFLDTITFVQLTRVSVLLGSCTAPLPSTQIWIRSSRSDLLFSPETSF